MSPDSCAHVEAGAARNSLENSRRVSPTKTAEGQVICKTEVDALTASIEEKTQRIGNLGVKIGGLKQDLNVAEESLIEDLHTTWDR